MKKKVILEEQEISDKLVKIAEGIVKKNSSLENLALVGIRTGGAFLAHRLHEVIRETTRTEIPVGILDITLYRDDWTRIGPAPSVGKTELPFSLDEKTIVLVDDVIFTGRTVRAAMDALMDFGRPRKIELAILVDRGDEHRELPITANYAGGKWKTAPDQTINVYLKEEGHADHVAIEQKKAA
jgi:pyrimidine operon attenuation protein/uracil phosphoribosyltransferase